MSRTMTARWEDRSDTESQDEVTDLDQDDAGVPTRRVPMFVLSEEAKRVERMLTANASVAKPAHADEATLNVSPEESRRLLADAFAKREPSTKPGKAGRNTDDEVTLDTPSPMTLVELPSPAQDEPIRARAQAPTQPEIQTRTEPMMLAAQPHHALVLTSMPPARLPVAPTAVMQLPELAVPVAVEKSPTSGVRQTMAHSIAPATEPEPSAKTQRWIVAGIWATALGLIAVLMLMVSST